MHNFIDKLNNIVKFHIEDYYKNNKLRKTNISIHEVLEYIFLYSNINHTKESSKAKTNINNNKTRSRSSFERNIKKLDISFFQDLHTKVLNFFNEESINYNHITQILNDTNININLLNSEYTVSPIDGICGQRTENNKLHTDINVYKYDSINNIPLALMDSKNIKIFDNNKNNKSNKNSETIILKNFINKYTGTDKVNESIFIGDRLYSSYNVITNFTENNCFFIVRAKDNLDILKDDYVAKIKAQKIIKNTNKNKTILNNDIRSVYYNVTAIEIIKNKNKNKELLLNINKKYVLLTNLPKEIYSNETVQLMYKLRWNIEVFFKLLKNNFKYDIFYLKDKDEIEKIKYVEMTIIILNKLICLYCLDKKYKLNSALFDDNVKIKESTLKNKDMRYKKNKEAYQQYLKQQYYKCSIRINASLSLTGFYEIITHKIINGILTENDIDNYNKHYVNIQKNKLDRNFARISISPYSKWYIKHYSRITEFKKIIIAINNNDLKGLNKNLKLKAKEILLQPNIKILIEQLVNVLY
jgi:hypothetical protein